MKKIAPFKNWIVPRFVFIAIPMFTLEKQTSEINLFHKCVKTRVHFTYSNFLTDKIFSCFKQITI
jgi:hypothetical protein